MAMTLENPTSILRGARRRPASDIRQDLNVSESRTSPHSMQEFEARFDKWLEVMGKELRHVKAICREEQLAREKLEARCACLETIVEQQADELQAFRSQFEQAAIAEQPGQPLAPSAPHQSEITSVILHRSAGEEFGIVISATHSTIVISSIIPRSPASQDGRIGRGDEILEINGESTSSMSPGDASNHIRWAGHTLMLEVKQSKQAPMKKHDYQQTGIVGQPQPLGELSMDFDNTMERRVRFTDNISRKYFAQEDVSLSVSREQIFNSPMRGEFGARRRQQQQQQPPATIILEDDQGSKLKEDYSGMPPLLDASLPHDHEAQLDVEVQQTLQKFREEYPQYAMRYVTLHKVGF
eukprot:m.91359 g.91359  ORF g.91359 m.91359 type:complete len:354 (-) comp14906_c0_seq21:733-1794(-)